MAEYIRSLRIALDVLPRADKIKYWASIFGRSIIGLLDLFAILGIGLLVSLFTIDTKSESNMKLWGIELPFNVGNYQLLLFAILGIFLLKAFLATYFIRNTGLRLARAEARAVRIISERYLKLSSTSQVQIGRNELLYAVQIGCQALFSGLLASTSTLISEGALFVSLLIAFFVIDPLATIGLILFFTLMAANIQIMIARKSSQVSEANAKHTVELIQLLNESIDTQRELLVLGRLQGYLKRIEAAGKKAAENYSRQLYLTGMPRYIVETGLILGVSVFAQIKLSGNNLETGLPTLAIFLTGGFRIMAAMLPWQTAIVNIKQQIPQAKQATDLLSIPSPIENQDFKSGTDDWRVKFSDVLFVYPGSSRKAIQLTNLDLNFRERIAVLGNSGAGKSTFVSLLLGLLEPTKGKVLVNGISPVSLTHVKPGSLSFVPQSPKLIRGTLLENICLGLDSQSLDRNRALDCINRSDLDGVVSHLPDGLDTFLDPESSGLSVGEVQRIGLARALYSDPKILILDEPTASVDSSSAKKIIKALNSLRESCTVIMITHNSDSIKHFDRFITVQDGHLKMFASHRHATRFLATEEGISGK